MSTETPSVTGGNGMVRPEFVAAAQRIRMWFVFNGENVPERAVVRKLRPLLPSCNEATLYELARIIQQQQSRIPPPVSE